MKRRVAADVFATFKRPDSRKLDFAYLAACWPTETGGLSFGFDLWPLQWQDPSTRRTIVFRFRAGFSIDAPDERNRPVGDLLAVVERPEEKSLFLTMGGLWIDEARRNLNATLLTEPLGWSTTRGGIFRPSDARRFLIVSWRPDVTLRTPISAEPELDSGEGVPPPLPDDDDIPF